jgi:hypothetical protein
MAAKLEIVGELAWEGHDDQAGVRFKNATDEQRKALREWLSTHLPAAEQDEPLNCRLTDLSLGACYLTTESPFPRGTRVILSIKSGDLELHAGGVVLVMHPEFGMGVQFLQSTAEQREHVHRMISALRAGGDQSPQLQVQADGLESRSETQSARESFGRFQVFANQVSETDVPGGEDSGTRDALVDLFRDKYQEPVEAFLQQMREQRASAHAAGS